MKEIIHDLRHDLTFYAHTIDCVCHSIRSIFRVLGIYNFGGSDNRDVQKTRMKRGLKFKVDVLASQFIIQKKKKQTFVYMFYLKRT